MSFDTDVVIVGAGPVGLCLANDLAMRGVSFEVIDAMPEPITKAKAHGFLGRTIEMLDICGLAEPLVRAGDFPLPGTATYADGRLVRHTRNRSSRYHHDPYPYSLPQPQQVTERVLEGELEMRGHKVRRSTAMVGFDQDDDGVTVYVESTVGAEGELRDHTGGQLSEADGPGVSRRGHEAIRARWMIGCDGGHSRARKLLGLDLQGRSLPVVTWLTECTIDWTHPRDLWTSFTSPDGNVACVYITYSGKWHLLASHTSFEGKEPDLDTLQAAFREMSKMPDVVLRDAMWVHRTDGSNFRLPERFTVGRVILAGDAAHIRSAVGGTGMNGGVQDALNLGWKLALDVEGVAAPGLVGTYEEERHAEAVRLGVVVEEASRRMYLASGRLPAMPKSDSPLDRMKARAGLRLAMARVKAEKAVREKAAELVPAYAHALERRAAMMNVHTRGASLTRQGPPAPADRAESLRRWLGSRSELLGALLGPHDVHAGDFLPDADCRVGGSGARLRDILRGPHATLLLFAGDEPTAATVAALEGVARVVGPLGTHVKVHYVFPSEGWADRSGHPHDSPAVVVDGLFQVRHALGVDGPEVVYVRPDGHIGLRTVDLDPEGVLGYLRLVYRPELLAGSASSR